MMNRVRAGIAVGVLLLAGLVWSEGARAGEATELVRKSTDQVIEILKDPVLKDRPDVRDEKIWQVVLRCFDFEEMGRRSLGIHWRERSAQEQKEFVELFGRLIHKSYAGRVASYSDEKVDYLGEAVDGARAEVKTKVVSKGTEIPVEYRLLQKSSSWVIYDVVIEGVSLVNNYRNQFNRIVVQKGYRELERMMKTKLDELIKETEKQKKESA
jgi:phospholipid transport system substrate-binding protein